MGIADLQRLIEIEFPLERVSEECSKEKSIRQGHISTLQQWWARRPLAVCRAAIFAALCPSPETVEASPRMMSILNQSGVNGDTTLEKLSAFTAKLSSWDAASNDELLKQAQLLLLHGRDRVPLVADTFAGGGSIPIEALRLGLDAFAGELNPVAASALKLAIEHLPKCDKKLFDTYRRLASEIAKRVKRVSGRIYSTGTQEAPLAFFWCRTYQCPNCATEVPLLHDCWLEKGTRKSAVSLKYVKGSKRFDFKVYTPTSAQEAKASSGTVKRTAAECPRCKVEVSMSWLREQAIAGKISDRLYAKLVKDASGRRVYSCASHLDEAIAARATLRRLPNRKHKTVPDQIFDKNGIRHTWAIQYGVKSTADLFNKRQSIALLELFHELEVTKKQLLTAHGNTSEVQALTLLLALTFNRLIVYNNRHAWWQSNGGFPANMFGRQAIPMVWNYVEIPINSIGAAGWSSAVIWIEKVARHLGKLPGKGSVQLGDAAKCALGTQSADLIAIDPPYYDTIAYSYLSDTFYVWMKELLGDLLPDYFSTSLTPKAEEAIVDRPHRLAPSPKTDQHFRSKMLHSLQEAKRILRPDGRLILMFGHKKFDAWDAMLNAVLEAGFVPTVSLPIHTERKVKFRHGHIDALSSSCLIVCVPDNGRELRDMRWADFEQELKKHLTISIKRFQKAHLFGADLTTSLIAPACALFHSFNVFMEDKSKLSIGRLISRLPDLTTECEYEAIINQPSVQKYSAVWSVIKTLAPINNEINPNDRKVQSRTWRHFEKKHWLIASAVRHANLLWEGSQKEADLLWRKLTSEDKEVLCYFLRAAALSSNANLYDQQLAHASLGRISLQTRAKNTLFQDT